MSLNHKTFVPELFISVGETGAFYTLRETYLHAVRGSGPMGNAIVNGVYQGSYEVRSAHIQNLSQDAEEAIEKAEEYSKHTGTPLQAPRGLREKMREIHRATAEEMEARRQREAEDWARWEEQRKEREAAKRDQVSSGVFPFGPYMGTKFAEAPRGYVNWFMDMRETFEEGSLIRLVADTLCRDYSELALPKPDKDLWVGEPKKRMTFNVFVLRSIKLFSEQWGTSWMTIMIDLDTKACLAVRSGAFSPDEGETLKIKGTVKEHNTWNGQAQTFIQRVVKLDD